MEHELVTALLSMAEAHYNGLCDRVRVHRDSEYFLTQCVLIDRVVSLLHERETPEASYATNGAEWLRLGMPG